MNLFHAKVHKRTPLDNPKWVRTERIHYTAPDGTERDWECCSRTTRPEGTVCDGVAIVAILDKPEGRELLLEKQFRAPIGGVCIELPAGLLDANESVETCAERELLEETGYVGKAQSVSPLCFNDPGFCNTNLKLVRVLVDLTLEENKNPQPQLEENEFIETFSVPLASLSKELALLESQGYLLDARVQNIADGIEIGASLPA